MNIRFEPVCYDHAAALIGERPWDVSKDGELMVAAFEKTMKKYGLASFVVGIDIYNLEPEAYGCKVEKPRGNGAPAIKYSLCTDIQEIHDLELNPEEDARLPLILNTAAELKKRYPRIDVRVPLSGPFTIAAHLLGLEELLWQVVSSPKEVKSALFHLAEQQISYMYAARERGLGTTFFESSVTPPLLSPAMFNDSVVPAIKHTFDALRQTDEERPHLIIGGNTTSILDGILECDPAYIICPYETDQEAFLQHLKGRNKPAVRVNLNPEVFTAEQIDPVSKEVKRTAKLASAYEVAVSIGTILPYDAKPERVDKAYNVLNDFFLEDESRKLNHSGPGAR